MSDGRGAERFLESVSPDAIATLIGDPELVYLKATNNRQLIGVAALRGGSHLLHLFVDPEWQKLGVARTLWQDLLIYINPEIDRITVNSSPVAVSVYQRFGFVIKGSREEKHGIAYIPMEYPVK